MLYYRPSPYANYHWAICRSDLRGVLAFAETMQEAAEMMNQFPVPTVLVHLGAKPQLTVLRNVFGFSGKLAQVDDEDDKQK